MQCHHGLRDGHMSEGHKRLFLSDTSYHMSRPWWIHYLHLCSHTFSLSSSLFFFSLPVYPSHSQPSLTHICLLLVTSSFLNFSHSTSFRQPIFCCLLSLSLNFLLHYSFLTFGAASADETLPLRISVLFYPFQRWVIWEEWKKRGGRPLTPWPLQAGDQILLLCLWFIMSPISEGGGCYCIFPLWWNVSLLIGFVFITDWKV